MIKNKYSLPRVDDLFDQLKRAIDFSKTDLRSDYHQLKIKESDVPKLTFWTRYDHYELVVIPFNLTNSPAAFMDPMNKVFKEYMDKFVIVFINNNLINSKTWEEHEEHLRMVLQKLQEHQWYVMFSKCEFWLDYEAFLGYVISKEEVIVNPTKMAVARE